MKLLRQSGWITLEHGVAALSQLAMSGWLIAHLGLAGFGQWTLVHACMNLCSLLSTGVGSGVLRHVSAARSADERSAWVRAGTQLFALSAVVLAACIAIAAGAIAWSCSSDWCSPHQWLPAGDVALIAQVLPALAAAILLQEFDGVLLATLRAEQRYAIVAQVEVASRVLWLCGLGGVAAATLDVVYVLLCVPLLLVPKVLVHLWLLARGGIRWRGHVPAGGELRTLFGFARWQWLRGIGVMLFFVADRLVIASTLGSAALGIYAVCLQLAEPLYKITILGLQPMFPWASRQPDLAGALRRWLRHLAALELAILAGGLLWIPLTIAVLPWWLGPLAEDHAPVQAWAVLACLLPALHVVPNYLQMGAGQIRMVAAGSLAGGIATLALMALAAPAGLDATMAARCVFGLCLFVSWPTLWRLLRQPSGSIC